MREYIDIQNELYELQDKIDKKNAFANAINVLIIFIKYFLVVINKTKHN